MPSLTNKCLECPLKTIDTTKALSIEASQKLGGTVISAVNRAAGFGDVWTRNKQINSAARACVQTIIDGGCPRFKIDPNRNGFAFKNRAGK